MDLQIQVNALNLETSVSYMSEEAMDVVEWLFCPENKADCIIADTEVCDGNTLEIFIQSNVSLPLILTSRTADVSVSMQRLNVAASILKPVRSNDLKNALSKTTLNKII